MYTKGSIPTTSTFLAQIIPNPRLSLVLTSNFFSHPTLHRGIANLYFIKARATRGNADLHVSWCRRQETGYKNLASRTLSSKVKITKSSYLTIPVISIVATLPFVNCYYTTINTTSTTPTTTTTTIGDLQQ